MTSQTLLARARLGLICVSVAANAICAGGIYCFPLISPALSLHMKLDQLQLTTIALAGMIGQYPVAAFVGKVIDHYGPWLCSLVASVLFSAGFGLFSWETSDAPSGVAEPSLASFRRLVLFFGMAGLGTVFSYFSLVFAATKTFPEYIGIASGTSMALFGLSPLFLSAIASGLFTDADGVLYMTRFFAFMAVLTGVVHLFGALTLPGPTPNSKTAPATSNPQELLDEDAEDSDEVDPLLPPTNKPQTAVNVVSVQEPQHGTTADLLKDAHFWLLAVIVALIVGAAEMVISNMGSIVSSISPPSSASRHISTQVQLLSISNTASRLFMGPLADFVSPVASYLPNGVWSFPRRHHVSRVVFFIIASIVLAATFTWLIVGIRSPASMWTLSIGTGSVYGTIFTLLPSIMASIWGLPNLGRNFGIISYAAFIGTPIFSYLYAFVVARHTTPGGRACEGVQCWKLTFGLSVGTTLIATCLTILLWRRWRSRV
ncbi:MFS general substrate transporter [Obba rivulosa]|uniref:MFS general substrate transporter n=1 Tax=Obba rivulosa TaxID=1052685 RepID=A0A8E2DSI9_9APHY|nr:MFS general substrate transporter [Obba rivulosa]